MIITPDRVAEARAALERGERPDYARLAELQMLDLVIAGREHVERAIAANEIAYERAAALVER